MTLLVIVDHVRFRKSSTVAQGYVNGCLKPATKQWREMTRRRELTRYVESNPDQLKLLSMDTLESVVAAMKGTEK
jgi:hypothetical protein